MYLNVAFQPSTIKDNRVRQGLFVTKPIERGDMLGYYYGHRVYAYIKDEPKNTRTYVEGVIVLTAAAF